MAQSKYIQSVKKAAAGRPKSTQWYRNKIKEFGTPTQAQLLREGKVTARPNFGKLNLFVYDPKFKKTLPYYDTFPLVLPIDTFKGGFLGFNLHYLPINLRIRLLDRLIDDTNNVNFKDRFFNVKIAICRIYNKVLTGTEVKQNYHAHKWRYEF